MLQSALRGFPKRHEYFVGIDSDGCAFDTMEVKHKECFIPPLVRVFGLAAVSRYVREAAEFVNLYSKWRGENRFPAYIRALDFAAARAEVRARGVPIPRLEGLRAWIARETKLSNKALALEVETTKDADLAWTLEWSHAVNEAVEATVRHVPPFPGVRDALRRLALVADVMVVSATPGEALEREWREHDLSGHVGLIAGQELGSKKEHLAAAAVGRYPPERILMIGDAPGDWNAARANQAQFFPIEPGHEEESWQRFLSDGIPRFLEGRFEGDYMAGLLARFERLLPEVPPWQHAEASDSKRG
jgi:phosphoglycolate phosphatase-like HAD superfamily hydrolase